MFRETLFGNVERVSSREAYLAEGGETPRPSAEGEPHGSTTTHHHAETSR